MRTPAISIGLLLLFAVRPTLAAEPQEEPSITVLPGRTASPSARPLAVPAPIPTPPSEGGLTAAQILLGTLATLGIGSTTVLVFAGLDYAPLLYLGLAITPAIGSAAVCGVGRWSRSYEGSCAPAVIGGYLGAIVVGTALGLFLVSINAFAFDDNQEFNDRANFAIGAFLGGTIGTAVGSTIGWHLGKHLRADAGAAVSLFAPPVPPPAALADWPELRTRSIAAPTGLVVNLPLLAVRF
jgi:hypothetical protein